MRNLLNAFSPSTDTEIERSRQILVWESLVSACKYVSAYRSRSAANNALGLDDVSAVAPHALRMSIHNKSPDNGVQFPVKVGVNVHRTPWHGTAEVRFSRREKSLVIDTKLAAEMWSTHVAVLPSLTQRTEGMGDGRAAAWQRYATKLADARQPLFFADVSTLPSKWHDDVVLASLPMPAKLAPKVREDRRMRKKRTAETSPEDCGAGNSALDLACSESLVSRHQASTSASCESLQEVSNLAYIMDDVVLPKLPAKLFALLEHFLGLTKGTAL